MLKLKLQYFGHLMWRIDSFEKTLMLGKIEGGRRGGRQMMRWLDGITDSMEMSWVNSGIWWWTGMPGVLWSMGSWRVEHNWATELNWIRPMPWVWFSCFFFPSQKNYFQVLIYLLKNMHYWSNERKNSKQWRYSYINYQLTLSSGTQYNFHLFGGLRLYSSYISVSFSLMCCVVLSHSVVLDSLWPHGL